MKEENIRIIAHNIPSTAKTTAIQNNAVRILSYKSICLTPFSKRLLVLWLDEAIKSGELQ
jgi:hypothetical protein